MLDTSSWPGVVADVSHAQGKIDWPAVAGSGLCSLAIIKATQGTHYVDPRFEENRKGAIDHKIRWIPYAFLTTDPPEEQARHFLDVAGAAGIPAALDWETPDIAASVMETFGSLVRDATGRLPLAYYGLSPPDPVTAEIAKWPRWFPEYAAQPKLPPWDGASDDWSKCWWLWQYTDKGHIPGITGNVDRSRIAGTLQQLLTWYDTGELAPRIA
jgi:lysozyme